MERNGYHKTDDAESDASVKPLAPYIDLNGATYEAPRSNIAATMNRFTKGSLSCHIEYHGATKMARSRTTFGSWIARAYPEIEMIHLERETGRTQMFSSGIHWKIERKTTTIAQATVTAMRA